jgi:hypothetical protein
MLNTLSYLIPTKTISVLKVLTYINTVRPIGLAAILVIMSVSTFKKTVTTLFYIYRIYNIK